MGTDIDLRGALAIWCTPNKAAISGNTISSAPQSCRALNIFDGLGAIKPEISSGQTSMGSKLVSTPALTCSDIRSSVSSSRVPFEPADSLARRKIQSAGSDCEYKNWLSFELMILEISYLKLIMMLFKSITVTKYYRENIASPRQCKCG
jgi:hypothetical protein